MILRTEDANNQRQYCILALEDVVLAPEIRIRQLVDYFLHVLN